VGKALVITEKPSVARDIADALEGFEEHDGYFESDDFVVTFAVGHLFELLAPEEVDEKYKAWTLEVLPILPRDGQFNLKPKKGHSERIRTIKKLLKRDDVDRVVNACDAGREGELIFREIVDYLDCEKPIERLWLQSMTVDAIRDGFQQLSPGEDFERLAAAAECRAYSDWLIGMNATRALTKRLASKKERTAWSAGRVQTPTLAILVDRELEVLAHVARPYWRVVARFERGGEVYESTWFDPDFQQGEDEDAREDRIFDLERARAIVDRVSGQAAVARETRKPSRESAPPLFDLTSLQRECNRRFSWSARRTLSAAQRCYERHKVVTYPRTDSRCLPEDYRETVGNVLESLAGASDHPEEDFQSYARSAATLREAGLQNDKRNFDNAGVSDHFAIIPTGTLPEEPLTGDDKRLYDLVVRRFLGAFFPPAEWERVERVTTLEGESFQTRARSLKEPGWRAVLPGSDDEEPSETLPPLVPGQNEVGDVDVANTHAESQEEETRPPPRISEARLLSLMENAGKQIDDDDIASVLHDKGIGTPATRAEIFENLIRKGYVVRLGKGLRPTVKGIRLIDSLRRINIDRLASPGLTGELEKHLLDVEHGERSAEQFMAEITEYAESIVERAKTFGYEELYDDDPPIGTCPFGGKPVVERAWFYTCLKDPSLPREAKADENCAYEACPLLLWKDISGRYMDRRAAQALLEDGRTGELDGFTARSGRTYRGTIEIDREEAKVKVRSAGWNEESASDVPEYEVNPEPLGPIRCGEHDSRVIETSTEYICERDLSLEKQKIPQKPDEDAEQRKHRRAHNKEIQAQKCGFVLPRTVCKREITRDEAMLYLRTGRTELLTDFISRFGRPFSATLVLKDTGRHGFEFQPRGEAGSKKASKKKAAGAEDKAASAPRSARKKKAAPKKKAAAKKAASRKKSAARKSAGKKASRKKAPSKTAAATSGSDPAAASAETSRGD